MAAVDRRVVGVAVQPRAGVVDLVTAEIRIAFARLRDHRVVGMPGPVDQQIVMAFRDADAVRVAEVDEGRHALPADQGAAAEAADPIGSVRIRLQGDRMVHPVHEVDAGGVAPLDAVPVRAVRVELVEDVVAAAPEQGAVDVVHPRRRRHEVVAGPVAVAGQVGLQRGGLLDLRLGALDGLLCHGSPPAARTLPHAFMRVSAGSNRARPGATVTGNGSFMYSTCRRVPASACSGGR